MEGLAQILLHLAIALAVLLFFGPIVVIVSLIGNVEIGKFKIDVRTLGRFGRSILSFVGVAIWLSVYIPLILYVLYSSLILSPPSTANPTAAALTSPTPQASSPTATPTIGSPTVQPACPAQPNDTTSIRIRGVARACGCRASDFYIIQVDRRVIKVTGHWLNKQPDTALWAFLVEENRTILDARAVNPDTPGGSDWNIYLSIPEEADKPGKFFAVFMLIFEGEDTPPALSSRLPDPGQGQPYQEVRVERVSVIEDPASICVEEL